MRAFVFALWLAVAGPAAADECAKYSDPLAYNSCLARQGPAARAVRVGKAPVGRAPAARRGPAAVVRQGRSEMVFKMGR